MSITPVEISSAIGAPVANTAKYWPLIVAELQKTDTNKLAFQCAIVATIGVETGKFIPINEWGPESYFKSMYDIESANPDRRKVALALGNIYPGDGVKYHGRGFVQLTGRHNYLAYGKALGIDLINHPELANGDHESVAILVKYMHDHGIDIWADRAFRTDDDATYPEEMCTRKIRKLVNGGYNHYDQFKKCWDRIKVLALT